ncbi:unnamed protein product [Clavelina lepadiformis]|uniref:Ion transport domain-containing protein n=1 Tax=Clavelina lepadiformis TaxID=159417 RepID=A0ABP0FI83_CLALP
MASSYGKSSKNSNHSAAHSNLTDDEEEPVPLLSMMSSPESKHSNEIVGNHSVTSKPGKRKLKGVSGLIFGNRNKSKQRPPTWRNRYSNNLSYDSYYGDTVVPFSVYDVTTDRGQRQDMVKQNQSLCQLATQGNVKQLAALCNANPGRMLSCDRKGATILHHAAAAGQTAVINFILQSPGGPELLAMADDYKCTALHWAVEQDVPESVTLLLAGGADASIKNNSGHGALHLAVYKNSLKALKALLDSKTINFDDRGNSGVTALHVAASADHDDAFKMLMDAGAKPCLPCSQGYRPLHIAAMTGSRKVMRLLLEHAQQYGYTSEKLLSYGDKEQSSPLHSAVTGGNICAIELCLDHGARLDVKQADDSTPMHMVCAQGAVDIIKLMFDKAPDQARSSLLMLDKQDHSPLHKAAMFNHPSIVEYLVEQGADMELLDVDEKTALLVAASRESWDCVRTLLRLGANVMVKDKDERNLMHIIVLQKGDICFLAGRGLKEVHAICTNLLTKPDVFELMSRPDAYGCTPLHYACQEGNLASLKTLMKLGVSARLKSWKKQSAMHFASMYGRYNACVRLLDSDQGPNIINEKDDQGMTPLHFAAMNGHVKVVQLLMNRGAIIHRNLIGATPLHVAASSGYTRTIRSLVEMHGHLLDQVDGDGNTAMHLAASAGHVNAVELLLDLNASFIRNNDDETCFTEAITNQNQEVAMAIIQHGRWSEAMKPFSKADSTIVPPILLLIQYLPGVCVAVLDRCKEMADVDVRSEEYWIRYNFKYLQPSANARDEIIRKWKERQREEKNDEVVKKPANLIFSSMISNGSVALPALNVMVEFNRVECLRHPVSVAYLHQKWRSYGRLFHGINLIFYMMSLFPITYIAANINSFPHLENNGTEFPPGNETFSRIPVSFSSFEKSMMILLTVVNILQMVKEVVQMYQQRMSYFLDFTNLVEWTLYLTSVLYVAPFLTGYPVHWQFQVGAVAVFLAWFNLLVFLQKFDLAGIYVVMFMQILKTLIQVLLFFSFLIIAFALSFTVLMRNEADRAFSDPFLSMMRVTTMLLGEIGYLETFLAPYVDGKPETYHFGITSFLLLSVFILMMPILLMNLLIGLAVGDIAEVQNNAVLQRLAMQVQLHTSIESKLPAAFLERVDKNSVTFYPNRRCYMMQRVWNEVFKHTGVQTDYGDLRESRRGDPNMEHMRAEMMKQKRRMKSMQATLEKQHDLLRLIVQKMEIRSEADYQDEGFMEASHKGSSRLYPGLPGSSGSKLLALRALKSKKS